MSTREGWTVTAIPYRFERFQRELMLHDLRFEGGPGPGHPLPDFELPTIDGRHVSRDGLTQRRPMLVVLSSFT